MLPDQFQHMDRLPEPASYVPPVSPALVYLDRSDGGKDYYENTADGYRRIEAVTLVPLADFGTVLDLGGF